MGCELLQAEEYVLNKRIAILVWKMLESRT